MLAHPEAVAEHRHRSGAAPVVGGGERPADAGLHAEHVQEPPAHEEAGHHPGLAAVVEVESREGDTGDAVEGVLVVTHVLPHWMAEGGLHALRTLQRQAYQAVGAMDGERLEDQGLHNRENGERRADAHARRGRRLDPRPRAGVINHKVK